MGACWMEGNFAFKWRVTADPLLLTEAATTVGGATRVHGLVHVVDPGPARRSARTRAAAPARGPAPARARTPRARAAGLAVAPAPARAPGIELLC